MALYQRRDSVGRTRFLLALTLSTVTAVGVAAPLAIQTLREEAKPTFVAGNPDTDATADDESSSDGDDRSLDADIGGIGGIRSEPGASADTDAPQNDPQAPAADDPNGSGSDVAPASPQAPSDAPTSTIAGGSSSPHPEIPGTTSPDETTSTTDPDSTSTTDDPDGSTSSTTEAPPITNGETSSTTSETTTTTTTSAP